MEMKPEKYKRHVIHFEKLLNGHVEYFINDLMDKPSIEFFTKEQALHHAKKKITGLID